MKRSEATLAVAAGLVALLGVALLLYEVRGAHGRAGAPAPEPASELARVATAAEELAEAVDGSGPAHAAERAPAASAAAARGPARTARWIGHLVGAGAERAQVLRAPAGDEADWVRLDDGAGSFAYDDAPVGRALRVEVVPADGAPFDESFELSAPGTTGHDIQLAQTRRLETIARDAFSHQVVLGARLLGATLRGEVELATSDGMGRLVCDLRGPAARALANPEANASDIVLAATAEGYLRSEASLWALTHGRRFELVPAGTVVGRVLESDGKPAAGATVAWVAPFELHDARLGPLRVAASTLETTTDDDGSFRLRGVPWGPGRSELVARSGARERRVLDSAPIDARTPRELEIRLPAARGLDGRVVWDGALPEVETDLAAALAGQGTGFPAPQVTVRLVEVVDRGEHELARTATDALGRFSFADVPEGAARLALERLDPESADGAAETLAFRFVAPATNGTDALPCPATLAVRPPLRSVRGVLRSARGTPLARRELSAQLLLPDARTPAAQPFASASTGDDGAFELALPAFEGFRGLLSVIVGATRLEHDAEAQPADWTLPELVPVALELGEDPDSARLVAWRGPGRDEGGRSTRIEKPANGVLALALPLGEIELELTPVSPEPRAPTHAKVRVPAPEGATPVHVALP